MKEETEKKIYFNKSGTGGITPKVNIPADWLSDMGVNEKDKNVVLTYHQDKKEIRIKKKEQ